MVSFGLVYWGLTPQQQPGSYQGGEMMMKSVFWWRKPEYPEETTDLRQVTDETVHTYGLCPVRGLNLGRSGAKQSELRRDESGALAHRATEVPDRWSRGILPKNIKIYPCYLKFFSEIHNYTHLHTYTPVLMDTYAHFQC